jgi:deoxyribonuclease-4
MSIAGGYHKAVERAQEAGCDCVQVFTRNNTQWRAPPITPEQSRQFRDTLAQTCVSHPLSHSSYLINLASPDATLRKKSIDGFVVELQRAEQFGIPFVVVHPGAHTGAGLDEGLRRVVAALDEVRCQTRGMRARCLLENTAGQGTGVGWRFEHLATVLSGVRDPDWLGLCFDTCHAFAAGYALRTPKEYRATWRAFDRSVGLDRIHAFHLNDSQRARGSRVDRHAHIGHGQLGLDAFRHLLHDARFRCVPMYLETPKETTDEGEDWDAVNLRTLRGLLDPRAANPTASGGR